MRDDIYVDELVKKANGGMPISSEEDWASLMAVGDHQIRESERGDIEIAQKTIQPYGARAEVEAPSEKKPLLLSISEVLERASDPMSWIVKGWFLEDSTAVLFGPHKQYKTFVALDLALSIATGRPFLNTYPVKKKGMVIYVAGEGVRGLSHRVAAWLEHYGVDKNDVLFYQTSRAVHFLSPAEAIALRDEIQEKVDELGIEVTAVFIDTLARNFGDGDENKTPDMNLFVASCDRNIREYFGCLVAIIHHVGHGDGTRSRGSVALPAASDTSIKVSGSLNTIVVKPEFQKDAATPEGVVLEGKVIDLYTDEDGDPVSSVVLIMSDQDVPVDKSDDEPAGHTKILLDILREKTGPTPYAIVRDDWMKVAAEKVILKGKNAGKKRDKVGLRQAWSRTLKKAEECNSVTIMRDNSNTIKTLEIAGSVA